MHTLNIVNVLKKMTIRKLRDVIHENYCKRIGFPKEETYYLLEMKTEKKRFTIICYQINNKSSDNTREQYQSHLNKKNKKIVKLSKFISNQPNLKENWNIIGLKWVTIEYPKNYKLFKILKQAEIVGSGKNITTPLYGENTKRDSFLMKNGLMFTKVMQVLTMLKF